MLLVECVLYNVNPLQVDRPKIRAEPTLGPFVYTNVLGEGRRLIARPFVEGNPPEIVQSSQP